SPGFLLVAHAIEDCIRRGFHEFDFLRGEEEYKFRWKPEVRHNCRIIVARGHWLSKLLARKSQLALSLELSAKSLLHR
ncbi:MAG: GNAT family N-acetyltransferase, partial [bacterium]